jgi:hypothetical protein
MTLPRPEHNDNSRIENLRKKVDNKDYLEEAIHRIAQIISNEIVHGSAGGFAGSPAGGKGVSYNEQ